MDHRVFDSGSLTIEALPEGSAGNGEGRSSGITPHPIPDRSAKALAKLLYGWSKREVPPVRWLSIAADAGVVRWGKLVRPKWTDAIFGRTDLTLWLDVQWG